MQGQPSPLGRRCFDLGKRLSGAHTLAIPPCVHCLLGSKAGIEIQRSMSFSSCLQGAYSIVKGKVDRNVRCALTGVGAKAPELEGKQGLPPRAIRESFLEVVTLGLEYRFSRQRKNALCNCLHPQTSVPGGRCGEGWREASVDPGSPLGPPRGITEKGGVLKAGALPECSTLVGPLWVGLILVGRPRFPFSFSCPVSPCFRTHCG